MNGAKRLHRKIPGWWVFTKGTWFVFFLREITSLFVAYFAILFVFYIRAVADGPGSYQAFVAWLRRPGTTAFHCLVFVAVCWHTVTWFLAAPKAVRPRVAGKAVPPSAVLAGHYALWLVVSAALWWVLS